MRPDENTRIDAACDAYHAIHEPYQVMPSCMKADNDDNTSRLQKEKADTHTGKTSASFTKAVRGAEACRRHFKSGESQTREESVLRLWDDTGVDAPIISKILDSEWTASNSTTISLNSSSEAKGREAVLTESSARRQPHSDNFTLEMARVGEESVVGLSMSVIQQAGTREKMHLLKVQSISNTSDALQRQSQSSTLYLLGAAGDGEGSMDAFAANYTVSSCHMAKCFEPKDQYGDTQVVSKKESSALNCLKFNTIDEASTNQSKLMSTPREPEHAIKQEEEMQSMEAMQLANDNLDVAIAMDQMLEKLASEFERQERLSSYSLGVGQSNSH